MRCFSQSESCFFFPILPKMQNTTICVRIKVHSTDGNDCCSTLALLHCHLLDMQREAELTSLHKTAIPTFCMSVLGQSQRQRCTSPEIQSSMLRQVHSGETTQYHSIVVTIKLNNDKADWYFSFCSYAPHRANLSLFQEQLHSNFTSPWIQSSIESPVVHHRVEPLNRFLGPTDPIHRHHLKGEQRQEGTDYHQVKPIHFPYHWEFKKVVTNEADQCTNRTCNLRWTFPCVDNLKRSCTPAANPQEGN